MIVIPQGLAHLPARSAQESVPERPGLGCGFVSGFPKAGSAKRSKQHRLFTSQAPLPEPTRLWIQRAIERGPQRHVFSPAAWREGRAAQAQEESCSASAGSRQILSKRLKERSRQNTQEKQELRRGQEIKDKERGRQAHRAPSQSAGSQARAIGWARGP